MWVVGQKVIADFEPELGLGTVVAIHGMRQLEIRFDKADISRRYSSQSAPLRRLVLNPGQKFKTINGQSLTIKKIREVNGLFQYESEQGDKVWENELDVLLDEGNPFAKLLTSTWENPKTFELRKKAWELRSLSVAAEIRGLLGSRVTLLPHQLNIASEVARRESPRVLLSDEVGLGKTIEAGLIFSVLRALGRADRVLVLVPEGLQHQWLAEMHRRFNEMFSLIDEPRSEQEDLSQGQSAFAMNQRIICSIPFLKESPERLEQAVDEEWDLLIVDEAHRLLWNEKEPSIEWEIVRLLSAQSRGLLLLTATPQSQGIATSFGLLNLVDPERFHSFKKFQEQNLQMREIADLAKQVQEGVKTPALKKEFKKFFSKDKDLLETADKYFEGGPSEEVLQSLVDRHGTGRVVFRNRRSRIKGFPERNLNAHPVSPPEGYREFLGKLKPEKMDDEVLIGLASGGVELSPDSLEKEVFHSRASAVADILNSLGNDKVLLICSDPFHVRELQTWFRNNTAVRTAIFDEDLDVVERDRQAAWFSERDGARLLLCSEIGGEGRNFQFCHHLVVFDIPLHPDILEQRIGRLDRIGQKHTIQIHVPYFKDTPEEALLKWFNESLGIFSKPWSGIILGKALNSELAQTIRCYLPKDPDFSKRAKKLEKFLASSETALVKLRENQESGIDLLVDINSFNPVRGQALSDQIRSMDQNGKVKDFLDDSFEYFGVDFEKINERGSFKITMHSLTFVESFPGLSGNGELGATLSRSHALDREELAFLSVEHPVVQGALSLVLEGNVGKVSAGVGKLPVGMPMLFEILYVIETTAPADLELQRDLPTQVIAFTLSPEGELLEGVKGLSAENFKVALPAPQQKLGPSVKQTLTKVIEKSSKHAEKVAAVAIQKAKADWEKRSNGELKRLLELAKVNPLIQPDEIEAQKMKKQEGLDALEEVIPRLDAIRILVSPAS